MSRPLKWYTLLIINYMLFYSLTIIVLDGVAHFTHYEVAPLIFDGLLIVIIFYFIIITSIALAKAIHRLGKDK